VPPVDVPPVDVPPVDVPPVDVPPVDVPPDDVPPLEVPPEPALPPAADAPPVPSASSLSSSEQPAAKVRHPSVAKMEKLLSIRRVFMGISFQSPELRRTVRAGFNVLVDLVDFIVSRSRITFYNYCLFLKQCRMRRRFWSVWSFIARSLRDLEKSAEATRDRRPVPENMPDCRD
jgi:hypothetical protein